MDHIEYHIMDPSHNTDMKDTSSSIHPKPQADLMEGHQLDLPTSAPDRSSTDQSHHNLAPSFNSNTVHEEMESKVLTADLEGKAKAQPQSSDNTQAQVSSPRYRPADLISPRAKRHRDALADQDDSISTSTPAEADHEVGTTSLLSNLFNVTDRESQPQVKRVKISAEEEANAKSKSTFKGSGHGLLKEHLKDRQKEEDANIDGTGPPSHVVDLTADDDDDDDAEVVSAQHGNREVCLGTISGKVMAHRVPAANKTLSKHTENWPTSRMTLRPTVGQDRIFTAFDAKNNDFGKLDNITASALAPLMKLQHHNKLRLYPLIKERKKEADEQPLQIISRPLDISITLYSAANSVTGIGRHLSKRQIFLYKPVAVTYGTEVVNPHVPNYKVIPTKGNGSSLPTQVATYKTRTQEEIRSDVMGIIDRLGSSEDMPTREADTSLVLTELMPHQKQALWFLTKHETLPAANEEPNSLWKASYRKDGTKAWYNVITGDELKSVNRHAIQGGILADQMGLGKTLSVLSLICSSFTEATKFGKSDCEDQSMRNSKATLLLCPKSVLSNWDEQIKTHLHKKVKFYMYHGTNRQQDTDILAENNIVITSYSIAASEFSSSSGNYTALSRINWFRIVLDEAHMIRNQDTKVFKSTCALVGQRRWAVTGTPIQNRLDDLGALIKFVKVYPFHEKGSFEKHFMAPFKSREPQVVDNLRLLVQSLTLRRSKEKIDLPDRQEELVRLPFSDEEGALYNAFAKDANKKVKAMTRGSDRLRGRSYAHVLVNITRLRLLCAHGRELLSEDDMKVLQGSTWETAIDLGDEGDADKAALTEEQIYDTFYIMRESTMDICTCCTENIGRTADVDGENSDQDSDTEDEGNTSDIIGYLTPCLHLICPRCADGHWNEWIKTRTSDNYAHCPQCEQYTKAVLAPISQKSVDADMERRQNKKQQRATKKGMQYGGPHTKVKELINDLNKYREESQALAEIGEPPIRSVVFSGWTAYLDLIEIALKNEKIGFLRLDGKMSVSARSRVLTQFKTDPDTAVILVSIKAGGQGLNFTAANKVFMMEPQFNPGVEMQAVDRVHRLGQKRDVLIRRFIMAGSFEEKIVELQKKKIELANLATGTGGRQDAKEIFQNLMSLF